MEPLDSAIAPKNTPKEGGRRCGGGDGYAVRINARTADAVLRDHELGHTITIPIFARDWQLQKLMEGAVRIKL
jgi:hypothetical protein